jgi:hypothetical protein
VRAAVTKILVACVREHDWSRPLQGLAELVADHDSDELAAAGRDHGVLNMVHLSLSGLEDVDPELRSLLEGVYRLNVAHHLRTVGELGLAARGLDAAGVTFLVIKGPVLAEAIYPRFDLRPYSDLDLLVPEPLVPAALEALERAGGTVPRHDLDHVLRKYGQIQVQGRYGTRIDLHWHLINRQSVRRGFNLPVEELSERGRLVSVNGIEVRTLDAFDTLVHLSLHAGLAGGTRLISLKDVERTIAALNPDWAEVVHRARAWSAPDLVSVVLERARTILGADVPDDVLTALGPSRTWRRVIRIAEKVSPPACSGTRPSLTKALTRATRGGIAASIAALVRRRAAAFEPPRRSGTSTVTPTGDAESSGRSSGAGSPAGR